MVTPGGRLFWSRSISCLTRPTTCREFSPMSIITSPVTISPRPPRDTGAARVIGPGGARGGGERRRRGGWGHVGDRHRHAVPLVDDDRRDVGHVVRLALPADVAG